MFYRLQRFMYGRYGNDKLNVALLVLWVAFAAVNLFVHSLYLYLIGLVFPILCICRMFSKNTERRYRENAKFEGIWNKIKGKFQLQTLKIKQFKTHRFFKCPACSATIRIPKRKGKVTVRCTRCGHTFEKKILF